MFLKIDIIASHNQDLKNICLLVVMLSMDVSRNSFLVSKFTSCVYISSEFNLHCYKHIKINKFKINDSLHVVWNFLFWCNSLNTEILLVMLLINSTHKDNESQEQAVMNLVGSTNWKKQRRVVVNNGGGKIRWQIKEAAAAAVTHWWGGRRVRRLFMPTGP